MTDYRSLCTVLFVLWSAPSWVSAQVLRCEDAHGKVTYTNTRCPDRQAGKEVVPMLSAEEQAQQEAQYQQALERKREEQARLAERDAAQRKAEAERAAAQAAQRPPVIVEVQPPAAPNPAPVYGPLYPPRHPPVLRPKPPPPRPDPQAPGYNCNVFRCYDGQGNSWPRP